MKSTKRGRARARLSKGVLTENVIFSNGLGVCRLVPGAGQQSVCRRRTRDSNQQPLRLEIVQQVTSPSINPASFRIYTNIVGAVMSLSNNTTGTGPTLATLSITSPNPGISVYGQQIVTMTQTAASAMNKTYPGVVLTLTGGALPTGYPNTSTSVTLDSFDLTDVGQGADGATITFNPVGGFYNVTANLIITATFNKALSGAPDLTLAATNTAGGGGTFTMVPTADPKVYHYAPTLTTGNGTVTLTLANADTLAGYTINTVLSGNSYVVDNVDPTYTSSTISSNNSFDSTTAIAGTTVTLVITSADDIQQPAVVFKSGGVVVKNAATYAPTGDAKVWDALYDVSENDTSGIVIFDYTLTDLAGNTSNGIGVAPTAPAVTVDTIVPVMDQVNSSVENAAPGEANIIFNENLANTTFPPLANLVLNIDGNASNTTAITLVSPNVVFTFTPSRGEQWPSLDMQLYCSRREQ